MTLSDAVMGAKAGETELEADSGGSKRERAAAVGGAECMNVSLSVRQQKARDNE